MSPTAAPEAGRPSGPFGLRTRIGLAFGLLALLLSALLAGVVWATVSVYLLSQRESVTLSQAEANLAVVQSSLAAAERPLPQVLAGLPQATGTAVLVLHQGEWYSKTLESAEPDALPAGLRDLVSNGTPARQRVAIGGKPFVAVGLPLQSGAFFELFPLEELDQTYQTLSIALAGSATLAALVGSMLGRTAAGQALRPLTPVIRAARAIADGDLTARLDAGLDPDLEELAHSFNHTAQRLERRVAQDERFAGDVSHEMRTTLMAMLNSVEVINARREQLPAAAREPLDLLSQELQRFHVMVEDLLEISRETEGANALVLEQVVIGELVTAAADRAAGRPVTHVSPAVERLRMTVDKRRIERVLANLVHNAETHGHGLRQVAVEPCTNGIRIFVDDTGPGVPPDLRERVFERFAREPTGQSDGVGLGLAIVARHVQLHGGSVWVGDRPGGGARFVIELPGEAP